MILFMVQEFLGVLLVLFVSMAAILALGIVFILFQEAIRRIARWARAGVVPTEGLSSRNAWLQRSGARSPLR